MMRHLFVLEYHDVIAGADWDASGFSGNAANSYKLAAPLFDAHLDAISGIAQDTGRDVRLLHASANPAPAVLFTFDDGGSSALHDIADRLERRGWRGHFLMTTGRIGTPGFLTAADLIDLHRRGHVVGSHSETHPARMSLLSAAEQAREWLRSREQLQAILGVSVDVASVPGGYFDRQTAHTAAAAGIRWLFTSEPVSRVYSVEGCDVIGRYTLRRQSRQSTARALVGRWPAARAAQWLKWNAKKVAKRAAGDTYLRIRAARFGDTDA